MATTIMRPQADGQVLLEHEVMLHNRVKAADVRSHLNLQDEALRATRHAQQAPRAQAAVECEAVVAAVHEAVVVEVPEAAVVAAAVDDGNYIKVKLS